MRVVGRVSVGTQTSTRNGKQTAVLVGDADVESNNMENPKRESTFVCGSPKPNTHPTLQDTTSKSKEPDYNGVINGTVNPADLTCCQTLRVLMMYNFPSIYAMCSLVLFFSPVMLTAYISHIQCENTASTLPLNPNNSSQGEDELVPRFAPRMDTLFLMQIYMHIIIIVIQFSGIFVLFGMTKDQIIICVNLYLILVIAYHVLVFTRDILHLYPKNETVDRLPAMAQLCMFPAILGLGHAAKHGKNEPSLYDRGRMWDRAQARARAVPRARADARF